MKVVVVIPFRDRGIDPLRRLNMDYVRDYWALNPITGNHTVCVRCDGRSGTEQFNRSAAYNKGVYDFPRAEVYVFAEADMIVPIPQMRLAVDMAHSEAGLVVPFTIYHYLSPRESSHVRNHELQADECVGMWMMANGTSIGAVNVVSHKTMERVGCWDERFAGNWYDDDAMKIAFDRTCGATRWVEGHAYHLHHLPGHRGAHLSAEDRAATRDNRARLALYQVARSADRIRALTAGAD